MTSHFLHSIFIGQRRDGLSGGPGMRSYAAGMSTPEFTPYDEVPDGANAGLAVAMILFISPLITIAGLI